MRRLGATYHHLVDYGKIRSGGPMKPDTLRSLVPKLRSGPANRSLCAWIVVGLASVTCAFAGPPPGNIGQLQQLNRESEATLRTIQRPAGPRRLVEKPPAIQKRLDRQQRQDQQWLQERQRRELLILNHRARTDTRPGLPYSLQGINAQGRFQRQQQNQLNRFRLQRGSPLR